MVLHHPFLRSLHYLAVLLATLPGRGHAGICDNSLFTGGSQVFQPLQLCLDPGSPEETR